MAKVTKVGAREILDSRGNPTVETTVLLSDGSWGVSSVPSGISVGKYEAVELRDRDPNRFGGLGVLKAVGNVNMVIAPKLLGFDPIKQKEIDMVMMGLDGTENKGKLGANAILSVSQAVCKAASMSLRTGLFQYIGKLAGEYGLTNTASRIPTPMLNIVNGGKHGAGNLDFQEFMVIPSSNKKFSDALHMGVVIYNALRDVLIFRNAIHSIGDEGGFAPNLFTNSEAFEVIVEAAKASGARLGYDVFFGLDAAASYFKKMGGYQLKDRPQLFSTDQLVDYYKTLVSTYQILVLEDAFEEDDWEGWVKLTRELSDKLLIVGDDLLATNKSRLTRAISEKAANAILVKPNQIGTVSETLALIKQARQANFRIIVSHRSGETNDSFIADFAVGVSADYIKFGAPARGERVAKYNRLLEIEQSFV
ncbi:phosphopyruvate hydratase [Candidatus Microgenomates bacterium]|nr:phosphopyruvate hydratase [Candidatus Microgenomates bacterium]MBI2622154.1 phosphopyruvate hydratase [Candidatus Microgenomates bacterium]